MSDEENMKSFNDKDFDEILEKCRNIIGVKGNDYTIGSVDKLHNFKSVAEFCNLTPMQVLGVYFYKHVSAIFSYIKNNGQKESEPIYGRIADIINYMLLFYKMIQENNKVKQQFDFPILPEIEIKHHLGQD